MKTPISRRVTAALLAFSLFSQCGAVLAAEFSTNGDIPRLNYQLPVSGLLMTQDPLRAQVISQIQALSQPQLPAALTMPGAPEAASIVSGLLQQPALLQEHQAELTQVLGPEHYQALAAAVGNTAVLKSLEGNGPAINPADAGAVAQLGERLPSIYDGNTSRTAAVGAGDAVAANDFAGEPNIPAEWRLSPSQKIHRAEPGSEAEALKSLARDLKIMELAPYQEKYVDQPVTAPLVAWAGLSSVWKLSIFRQGGRQDTGNILYVLDPSWVIQVPDGKGKNQIYVTKGLYFDKDGKTPILVTYKYPRRDRYFGNWLTMGAFDTASGVPLEKNLNTPMSSSSRLEKVTNDKLWTRLLLAAQGARVPATRAFLLPDHVFMKRGGEIPGNASVKAGPLPAKRAAVRRAVVEFLANYNGPEVVVKPSGPRFHSGEGVKFFPRSEVEKITDYVTELSKTEHMDSQGVVLLEQRLAPPPVYMELGPYSGTGPFVYRDKKKVSVRVMSQDEIAKAQPHEKKDSNERVYVVRDSKGHAYTVPMTFFRAGTWGLPTSGQPKDPRDAAAVVPWEVMRDAWHAQYGLFTTPAQVDSFMAEREDIGEKALTAIMANEKALAREEGEPYQAQTDMIGLDLMYQLENGRLVPYIIEVNDHDAAGQHALDLFYPSREGEHSQVWIETMRHRAQQDAEQNP
jgi:hypothetical protein